MKSLFIGIDWADEDHDVFITNETGKSLDAFAIDDSILGLHKFNSRISSYGVLMMLTSQLRHHTD